MTWVCEFHEASRMGPPSSELIFIMDTNNACVPLMIIQRVWHVCSRTYSSIFLFPFLHWKGGSSANSWDLSTASVRASERSSMETEEASSSPPSCCSAGFFKRAFFPPSSLGFHQLD
jgi:hypothetical protein